MLLTPYHHLESHFIGRLAEKYLCVRPINCSPPIRRRRRAGELLGSIEEHALQIASSTIRGDQGAMIVRSPFSSSIRAPEGAGQSPAP